VGIFNTLSNLCFGRQLGKSGSRAPNGRRLRLRQSQTRQCQVEALEPRQLLAASGLIPHVVLGSVYFEEATGDDSQPDVIQVSFQGGAPGTTLDRLVISGDKHANGLAEGDIIFDTAAGGLGAFQHDGLSIASHTGFTVDSVSVTDGGSQIVFTFSGFDAGEKLVFNIDADEAQFVEPGAVVNGQVVDVNGVDVNSLVEGGEFQRSTMVGEFSADGYVDMTLNGTYWDAFDGNFTAAHTATGLTLQLPNDNYDPQHDYADRTAGAVVYAQQVPLATLSGYVYHDRSDDGVFNRTGANPETGIGGVTLELLVDGAPTGITTTTSTNPNNLGYYEFRNLQAGNYGVREVQPSGWLDGKDTPGDHGGTAADESAGRVDRITGVVLNVGQDALEYNFGELLPGSIHGRIHADDGPDCDFDNPDILLEGVRVDLLDNNGQQIDYTFTDKNGEYEFTGLAPGDYSVREHQPTEYFDGGERVGTAGGAASDVAGVYSLISGIHITSSLDAFQYDFCEKVPAQLSGWVYHDRSNDGVFNTSTEQGIGGVVVELLDANGVPTGITTTTSTNANNLGYYEFTHLMAGTYGVREFQPANWLDGKDTPGSNGGTAADESAGRVDRITGAVLQFGDEAVNYDFGELLPSSIAGRVHADDGPDCDFDNPDILLPGVRLDLLDATGTLVAYTFTDANGEYEFDNLLPGEYQVFEHQPAGYFDGGERVGSVGGQLDGVDTIFGIVLGSGIDAVQYDFCEKLPGSISGRVHADSGPDCDFDNPDILLSGVRIDLLDGDGHLLDFTFTNSQGEYTFDELAPGEYQVFEHQPEGYYDGGERVGTAGGQSDGVDTIFGIELTAGFDATQYDYCEKVGVMLTGNVYHDRDNDGTFDRDTEEGIAGVTVKLIDANGVDTGLRAVTNGAGFYKFNNLAAGKYAVMEIQPAGWLDGIDTPGNLGGVADPSPPGDMIRMIMINWGDTGENYNFGELLPGSIQGQVFLCVAPNSPIPGVTIDLLNGSGQIVASAITDVNGNYKFTGLRPGTYQVVEHQPEGYFDNLAHLGSDGGTIIDSNHMSDLMVDSDEALLDYNFCESPPADLSGYVFIDGAPITTNSPLLPEEVAEFRDGLRTPDDTPLAGVVIELRNGVSGDPIRVGEALPGYYSGSANDPIRTVTDAHGYYHFGGLPGGTYGVVEVTPAGLIDGLDTPGTLGGFAINPVAPQSLTGLSTQSIVPPLGVQQTIEQFRQEVGNDAIVWIPLAAGQQSVENNFSEVRTQPLVLIENPPVTPIKPPVFAELGLPPVPPLYFPLLIPETEPRNTFGAAGAVGYTWHLSVVNAGQPRSSRVMSSLYQLTAAPMDSILWHNVITDAAHWTLATVDNSGQVVVVREVEFGNPNALPVVGDFNGDGVSEIGIFEDGHWYLDLNGNGVWDEGDLWAQLGSADDLPVTGDWDADGKTDIGIFGPAWPRDPWAIEKEPGLPDPDNYPTRIADKMKNMPPTPDEATSGARTLKLTVQGKTRADVIDHVFHYGVAGDVPLSGDWNGDGIRTIGVFRDGQWNLDSNGDGRFTEIDEIVSFGQKGDVPVVGDFNGDGVDEIGVFRNGRWILDTNGNHQIDAQDKVFELGGAGDRPVVGDWNHDGTDDPGVYTPGTVVDHVSRRAG
jgi:protocatechuate 3,4-dioxygenase beta subunit